MKVRGGEKRHYGYKTLARSSTWSTYQLRVTNLMIFCLVHVKYTVHGAFRVTISSHLTRKSALTFDFIDSSRSNECLCEVPVVIATVRVPEPLCVVILWSICTNRSSIEAKSLFPSRNSAKRKIGCKHRKSLFAYSYRDINRSPAVHCTTRIGKILGLDDL
jgi:hypothetical protein